MKKNKKGFTLAELLIVVAIIAVLVAISIPVFTAQLEKAKLATDTSNVRAAYAELVASALGNGATPEITTGSLQSHLPAASVNNGTTITIDSASGTITISRAKPGSNTIVFDKDCSASTGSYTGTK